MTSFGNLRDLCKLFSNLISFIRHSLAANRYDIVLESCEIMDEYRDCFWGKIRSLWLKEFHAKLNS